MPKVTVIIPTYRRDTVLKRALESVAEQTYRDFEVIVVDDNDDADWNTKVSDIVRDFCEKNPHLELVYFQNHPNMGSAESRNLGVGKAKGEYVTFLDDDDIYLPEKLEYQIQFMVDGNYDYSITDLDLFFENEKLSEHRLRDYIKKTDTDSLLRYHLMYHITGTDTMMYKTEYFTEIDGFAPIDIGDEFYLMQRAIEGKGNFGYLKRCDVKAYVHTGENGLSSGEGKICGENKLFEYKKKYFHLIDKKSRNYIKMRHHAVLAFAYLRMKKYGLFLKHSVNSFVISPFGCVQLLIKRV